MSEYVSVPYRIHLNIYQSQELFEYAAVKTYGMFFSTTVVNGFHFSYAETEQLAVMVELSQL